MAEESDGIEEAFEGQMRVLATAAGRAGETLARAREEAKRRALERSQREARELESRFEAERRAAHTEFSNVHRNDWWDRATPEQIANTYQTARAWSADDPEAVRAEVRLRDEMQTRYGVTPEELQATVHQAASAAEAERLAAAAEAERAASAAKAELGQAKEWFAQNDPRVLQRYELSLRGADTVEQERSDHRGLVQDWRTRTGQESQPEREAAAQRQRSAAEEAEAVRLLHEADRADNAAERSRTEAGNDPDAEQRLEERVQAEQRQAQADAARDAAQPLYDSAERRDATAADLESKGVSPEAVSAKMRADVSQAKPATEATKGPVGKSPKARKSRGRTPQAQRSEQGR